MMWGMTIGDWIGMIIGMTMMFAFLGGLILLAAWALRNVARPRELSDARHQATADRDRTAGEDTPFAIAEKRLARGEINREQFEELKTLLKHQD